MFSGELLSYCGISRVGSYYVTMISRVVDKQLLGGSVWSKVKRGSGWLLVIRYGIYRWLWLVARVRGSSWDIRVLLSGH